MSTGEDAGEKDMTRAMVVHYSDMGLSGTANHRPFASGEDQSETWTAVYRIGTIRAGGTKSTGQKKDLLLYMY